MEHDKEVHDRLGQRIFGKLCMCCGSWLRGEVHGRQRLEHGGMFCGQQLVIANGSSCGRLGHDDRLVREQVELISPRWRGSRPMEHGMWLRERHRRLKHKPRQLRMRTVKSKKKSKKIN